MKLKHLCFIYMLICFITVSQAQNSQSVFEILDNNNPSASASLNQQQSNDQFRFAQNNNAPILGPPSSSNSYSNQNSGNNLQAMLDKIKSKVTNPYLKDNLTLDNIANFFANFVAGNSFVNNMEVKELAELNKVEVKETLKVKNEAMIDSLSFNKLKSRALSIDDNEIIFDPEAILKLKNSKINFKVKDVFEVITFMKYIVKICGSKLEKCDFNTLLRNHNANQLLQLISAFEKKQKEALEKEKEKVKKENEKEKAKEEKEKNLRSEAKAAKEVKSENISHNFKETEKKVDSSLEDMEKEITNQMRFNQDQGDTLTMNEDYDKFLQNPQMVDFMNNYYYQMPMFQNNNQYSQ